jgi:hypothetical protein
VVVDNKSFHVSIPRAIALISLLAPLPKICRSDLASVAPAQTDAHA